MVLREDQAAAGRAHDPRAVFRRHHRHVPHIREVRRVRHLLDAEAIDESAFEDGLFTRGLPDPELLIRTSGETRISNYLLWQIAYAELYFTPVFWPDFNKERFYDAILNFQSRERRFGMTSEQVVGG